MLASRSSAKFPIKPLESERVASARPSRRLSFAGRLALGVWLAPFVLAAASRAADADPVIGVAPVVRETLGRDVTMQAEFKPYQEVDLHAKVAGYLKTMRVDIGDRVKAGDLLAVLEVPELQGDLTKAEATAKRAEANYRESHANFTRLQAVNKAQSNLVSQQDLDAAEAKDAAGAAAIAEARSDMEKFRTLESYTRITAPFDGVITKRFADAGALIQAGISSSTQAMPLVRLSQNNRLRLVVPVSMSAAASVKVGDPVEMNIGSSRRMNGKVARLSGRIATETRTMLAEVDVPNDDLQLIPGMYVAVTLKVDRREQVLTIPVESVSGAKHPTVYVVGQGQQLEEREVRLGVETPTRFEVLSGLREGELVMVGNRAQVRIGQKVSPKVIQLAAAP